ncbi:MAG: XTP/dITP diphosphatase [Promethearchaeota archaeon]
MKNNTKKIYFNTGNKGKFKEIADFFKKQNIPYQLEQISINVMEPQEETLENVAKMKIKQIIDLNNPQYNSNIVFIEDAGLFIDALKGFPGVFSSYVNKTIGNPGILKLMENKDNRNAFFKCIVATYFPKLNQIMLFDGIVKGKIGFQIKGTNGFGFDPIFIPDEFPNLTFAELTTEQKNKISHRGRAIRKFLNYLLNNE